MIPQGAARVYFDWWIAAINEKENQSMKQNFSLGIHHLWDELATLQQAGFYWVNIDRQVDAALFCQ